MMPKQSNFLYFSHEKGRPMAVDLFSARWQWVVQLVNDWVLCCCLLSTIVAHLRSNVHFLLLPIFFLIWMKNFSHTEKLKYLMEICVSSLSLPLFFLRFRGYKGRFVTWVRWMILGFGLLVNPNNEHSTQYVVFGPGLLPSLSPSGIHTVYSFHLNTTCSHCLAPTYKRENAKRPLPRTPEDK